MERIQGPSTIAKQRYSAAVLLAVVVALATFANASAMSSAHAHKGKSGNMKITTPTEVSGIVLQPGDYEVKEVNSPSGPVVEFVHLFDNFTAQEGLPVHDREIVGQVKVTEQALSVPPKHTQLIFTSNAAGASGLQVRGDDLSYTFAPSRMAENADTTGVRTNGQQE